MTARWMGAAPQRGSREVCTLRVSTVGMFSTACGK